jgi:hypothetical protein
MSEIVCALPNIRIYKITVCMNTQLYQNTRAKLMHITIHQNVILR